MIPWFYSVSRIVVRAILQLWNGLRVIDAQNVPPQGPVILACNHIAYLDPPALGCGLPRPVLYMAKTELFRIPVFGALIRALGAFPIDRSRGDVGAIKQAAALLRGGAVLCIFPEGTRNKDGKGKPQLGIALLASRTGATVVPAYVSGTSQAKHRAKVTVVYGEPIRFEPGRQARREDLAKWTDELMGRIFALREKIVGN